MVETVDAQLVRKLNPRWYSWADVGGKVRLATVASDVPLKNTSRPETLAKAAIITTTTANRHGDRPVLYIITQQRRQRTI